MRIVEISGRFLEIGKYDLANNTKLPSIYLLRNIDYQGIVLEHAMYNEHEWEQVGNRSTLKKVSTFA